MKIKLSLIASALALAVVGCVKDPINGPDPSGGGKVDGPCFDFSTTAQYLLDFQYEVPPGYVVGFDVYSEYPLVVDASGRTLIKEGLKPIERAFTDENGKYNHAIVVPSYVKEFYVYTTYPGILNRLLTAKITNGQLGPVQPYSASSAVRSKSAPALRASGTIEYKSKEVSVTNYGENITTKTLSPWHVANDPSDATLLNGKSVRIFGRPTELSYIDKSRFGDDGKAKDKLIIPSGVLETIRTALKGDQSGIPVDEKFLKSGDIQVSKEAELDLIFIQNEAAYRNVLAYYCYPTSKPPTSASDIKIQTIAIPNAMKEKNGGFMGQDFSDVVSMYQGEGVKLKYVDENGTMHDKFPAGVSVGWILYRNGYGGKMDKIPDFGLLQYSIPFVGVGANYSTRSLADSPNTAVLRHGDFVVIGFDDGDKDSGYRDYLDVMFNVKSSPSEAITDPIPDVDPEKPAPVEVSSMGILLFEDLWPSKGDFDMNDVVVKYVSSSTKNSENKLTASKIDFTVLHSGASINNTFAYEDKTLSSATVEVTGGPGGSEVDKANNIVIVAKDILGYANNKEKTTFTVNYTYTTPVAVTAGNMVSFNPYIMVGEPKEGPSNVGKEVHLTNYAPTVKADLSKWFNKADDCSNIDLKQYYITFEKPNPKKDEVRGMQLPFAVNIAFDSEEAMSKFVVTQESKFINKQYPGFASWVNSNGKENTDWYLKPID